MRGRDAGSGAVSRAARAPGQGEAVPAGAEARATESVARAVRRVIEAAAASAFSPTARFWAQAEAIDALEVHALERLELLEGHGPLTGELLALRARGLRLRRQLEAANVAQLRRLRDAIGSGRLHSGELRRSLVDAAGPRGRPAHYDTLDLLVGALLEHGAPGEEQVAREPEMVFYQPTPARKILELVDRAGLGPGDVFHDLGSGLGQVVILVSLLTGARARGIELEPAYVEYAWRSARALNAARVDFLTADVRAAPLEGSSVYFMYTPFRGRIMGAVLERLRAEARQRPIRVCTLGSCTHEVAAAGWLAPRAAGPLEADDIAVFTPKER